MKNIHQILSEMMQQGITQTDIHECRVDSCYYNPEEYMTLTNVQRFKLSLICDAMNRPRELRHVPGNIPCRIFRSNKLAQWWADLTYLDKTQPTDSHAL